MCRWGGISRIKGVIITWFFIDLVLFVESMQVLYVYFQGRAGSDSQSSNEVLAFSGKARAVLPGARLFVKFLPLAAVIFLSLVIE